MSRISEEEMEQMDKRLLRAPTFWGYAPPLRSNRRSVRCGFLRSGRELPDELRQLVEPSIDIEVYQAYIARAKELQPVAADQDVRDAMKNWYTELKTTLPDRYTAAEDPDENGLPIPVTAPKLDACYRFAEASARMRLSEETEMTDMVFVTPFIKKSLADIGIAPRDGSAFGSVGDVSRGELGI